MLLHGVGWRVTLRSFDSLKLGVRESFGMKAAMCASAHAVIAPLCYHKDDCSPCRLSAMCPAAEFLEST